MNKYVEEVIRNINEKYADQNYVFEKVGKDILNIFTRNVSEKAQYL